MLVRTWNVFHGNASPPERRAFLEQMIRLATGDRPDVVCLQELPVWSLTQLPGWSRMTVVGDVAARPQLGPLPATAETGRVLTDLHHGLLRSAFTGQANAVLVEPSFTLLEHRCVVLNPRSFRRSEGRRLGLDASARRAWGRERRICQTLRLGRGSSTLVVANVHATGAKDKRLPDAELFRATTFVDGIAEPDETVVFAGDFNVTLGGSTTLPALLSSEWGFSGAMPTGLDHVLVRGALASEPVVWPEEHRRADGRLLSDHAPVERVLAA